MTTLANLIEDCRQRYNAVGDRFFSDPEIIDLIYEAEMEIAEETEGLEKIYTTSTVASQREYDFPTNCLKIYRLTYNGERLQKIDFTEDDAFTGSRENTTTTGDPLYYSIFADRLFLRPVPAEVGTLKIFSISIPIELTSDTDSMNLPERYRIFVKDYVLSQMFAKDKNAGMVTYHEDRFQRHIKRIKRLEMKRQIGDVYPVVKDEDMLGVRTLEPFK